MGFLGWLFGEDEHGQDSRLQRDNGSASLGKAATSASPDNDRIPKNTPGTKGKNDDASFRSGFGKNPFKLSNQLELHVFSRGDMALPPGAKSLGNYCLFEYDGSTGQYHSAEKLTFPHGDKNRGYYQEGDAILVNELSVSIAERVHPEVVELLDVSEGFKMIANALDMKITVALVITRISGGPDPTQATVYTVMAILVGDDLFCIVDGTDKFWGLQEGEYSSWNRAAGRRGYKLTPSFRSARQDRSGWKFVKTVAPIIADLAVGVLRGAAPAARAIAFRTAGATLRRKLSRLLVVRVMLGAARQLLKATLAFSKAAALKYVELQLRPGQLRRREDGSLVVGSRDVEQIVLAGAEAVVNSLIADIGSKALKLPEVTDVKSRAAKAIAEELLGKFANAPQTLVSAHAAAAQDYLTKYPDRELDVRSREYQEFLAKKLQETFKNPLDAAVRSVCSSGSSFVKGIADEAS